VIQTDYWDVIVSIFCHLPPSIRVPLHANIVKGLRKGGFLVLEAFTVEQLIYKTGGPPTAELMMSLNDLRNEFIGLEFQHAIEKIRNIEEGKFHKGKSAVVQVLAIK